MVVKALAFWIVLIVVTDAPGGEDAAAGATSRSGPQQTIPMRLVRMIVPPVVFSFVSDSTKPASSAASRPRRTGSLDGDELREIDRSGELAVEPGGFGLEHRATLVTPRRVPSTLMPVCRPGRTPWTPGCA